MKLEIQREQLLKPLQHVIGVVERKQTLPVLANILINAGDDELTLTATDLEVEIIATIRMAVHEGGTTTLPARKLLDILRALPDDAALSLKVDDAKAQLRSGRSRFTLATLPAADFPALEDLAFEGRLSTIQGDLKKLIERTHFAVAQQDVRYYLNGLLLDVVEGRVRAVATDGHRLALDEIEVDGEKPLSRQVIMPRKGVQELLRLLADTDDNVSLGIGANHVQVDLDGTRFTTKLIDGKFPDYQRVVPAPGEHMIVADRLALRAALARAAILSSEKYRGIRLRVDNRTLQVQAHNPEQEEAEEEIEVEYEGGSLEIGFNVSYLLDALAALTGERVRLSFTDANSSCLLQEFEEGSARYVVMPMRL